MAISISDGYLACLKSYYKDGMSNLLFRNSPVLGKIKTTNVEGKDVKFSALASRGGAVSADYEKVVAIANANTGLVKEFTVTPGELHAAYVVSIDELMAAKTQKGAYKSIAGVKMFNSTEGFRKSLAMCLYGDGTGYLFTHTGKTGGESIPTAGSLEVAVSDTSAIMKIDIGTVLAVKTTKTAAETNYCEVVKISGNNVYLKAYAFSGAASAISLSATTDYYFHLAGSVDATGSLLPVGLASWLPSTAPSSGESFFGVDRSIAPERLAGARYSKGQSESVDSAIVNAMKLARRQGSMADMIVMNDNDFGDFCSATLSDNKFVTYTSTKTKKYASAGWTGAAAAFATNYIDSIIDDPFCPKGVAYILDSKTIEFWTYTSDNAQKDGNGQNEIDKAEEVVEGEEKGREYNLFADNYISIQPGTINKHGPTSIVSLHWKGNIVVTNPSLNCVVSL